LLISLFEDDLAIQEMLRLLLQSEGHEVAVYNGMEECLAHMGVDAPQSSTVRPDLLMIDLHLARPVSGLTIIKRIRAHPGLEHFPIILMTASTLVDRQELQRLRVTLLLKPFDIDEIIRIVGELATT